MKNILLLLLFCAVFAQGALAQISAGERQDLCADFAQLQATASSGYWTVLGGNGVFDNSTQPSTRVSRLAAGRNTFRWNYTVGQTSGTADVEVYNNLPSTPEISIKEAEVCDGKWTLAATALQLGSGMWTVESGRAILATPSNFFCAASGLAEGPNRFRWTATHKDDCKLWTETVITNNWVEARSQEIIKTCGTTGLLAAVAPPAGVAGQWTVITGTGKVANTALYNSAISQLSIGTNSLRWQVQKGRCISSVDAYVINQKTIAQATISTEHTCLAKATLSGSQAPNSYTTRWSIVEGGGVLESTSSFFTQISNLKNGRTGIEWRLTLENCSSADTVYVVNSLVKTYAGPSKAECKDYSEISASEPINGETGRWRLMQGGGAITHPTRHITSVTAVPLGSNIFQWKLVSADGMCADSASLEVSNSEFRISAGLSQTVCESTALLTADLPKYGRGVWSVDRGTAHFNNSVAASTPISGLSLGENVLRWTVEASECKATNTVTISNYNYPAVAQADTAICINSLTLRGNSPAPGNGWWTVLSGAGTFETSASPTSLVRAVGLGINEYRWTVHVQGCSKSDNVEVRNNYICTSAGNDQVVCANTALLQGSIPPGTRGQWTSDTPGVSFDVSTSYYTVVHVPRGESEMVWRIEALGCEASDMLRITNNAFDVSAGDDQLLDIPVATLTGNPPVTGQRGWWSVVSGNSVLVSPSESICQVTDLAPGQNEFRWTLDNGICQVFDLVRVVYASFAANAGPDQNLCGTETVMDANSPAGGHGVWRVLNGPATIDKPNDPRSPIRNIARGSAVLEWSITSNGFTARDTIELWNRSFDISIGEDIITCEEEVPLPGRALDENYEGTWTVDYGFGSFADVHNPTTTVRQMAPGRNDFRWMLRDKRYGCLASDVVMVNFKEPPVAEFNVSTDKGCSPMLVIFSNLSQDVQNQLWTFGDGTKSQSLNPTIVYTVDSARSFTVELVVQSSNLCTDTARRVIEVSPNFELSFVVNNDQLRIPFADMQAAIAVGRGLPYYRWHTGDGLVYSDVEDITHPYLKEGEYELRLIARNEYGCEQRTSKLITILPPFPVTAFEALPPSGCVPLTVQFANKTQFGTTYSWDFGDGERSIAMHPTKVYNQVGMYPVTLNATNELGTVSYVDTVWAEAIPILGFEVPVVIKQRNFPVPFENTTTGAFSYHWSFGDGATSTEKSPTHIYQENGLYSILLKASTEHGCEQQLQRLGYISVEMPAVSVNNAPVLSLRLYPNPATDVLHLSSEQAVTNDLQVHIYNSDGKLLIANTLQSGQKMLPIPVSELVPGAYIVRLLYQNKQQAFQFLKQ